MADADYNDYEFSSDSELSSTDSDRSLGSDYPAVASVESRSSYRVEEYEDASVDVSQASLSGKDEDVDYYANFGSDLERYADDERQLKGLHGHKRFKKLNSRTNSKEQGTTSEPKGRKRASREINFDAEGRLWYSHQDGTRSGLYISERAVYHHWIRADLSRMENAKGSYAFPAERGQGLGAWDVTCFCHTQQQWGLERPHYAPIMFEYECLDRENPQYHVGNLYHKGLLVIDYEGKPVRAFQEIPLVISSVFEGGFIEPSIRTHNGIKYRDIRARQPPLIELEDPAIMKNRKGKNYSAHILKPMYSTNALSQRARRFREKAGGISWRPEVNSPAVKAYMDSCPSQAARVGNSTRNCKDLSQAELAELKAATALTCP